jgi:hypothetical protein
MERGTYYSTDEVGAAIWSLIEAGSTEAGIVEAIEARFEAPPGEIEDAIAMFLGRLLAEELVASCGTADETRAPLPPARGEKTRFRAPTLQAYRDMQDMLSLDPIHDVEAAGWPVPKGEDDLAASPTK